MHTLKTMNFFMIAALNAARHCIKHPVNSKFYSGIKLSLFTNHSLDVSLFGQPVLRTPNGIFLVV